MIMVGRKEAVMQKGDYVRVRYLGRAYLAEAVAVTSRTAHLRFVSHVPNGRKRRRILPLAMFSEYGKSGVAYAAILKDERR
jgi:hypothetical protein